MMKSYLKVRRSCAACSERLDHHKADDLPAYLVILIVGKVVIAGMLAAELAWAPPTWLHWAIWPALTLLLALLLLPRIKGVVVGMQWALGMHGFEDTDEVSDTEAGQDQQPRP